MVDPRYSVVVLCSWCGGIILRSKYLIGRQNHFFCAAKCRSAFLSRAQNPEGYIRHDHLSEYNREHNDERMTPEVRIKLRLNRLGTGEGKCYRKYFGRAEHRLVAERILNRRLRKGEVVHHIDGDKRNNSPENLMVFENQKEHARWHANQSRGGDVKPMSKEFNPYPYQQHCIDEIVSKPNIGLFLDMG